MLFLSFLIHHPPPQKKNTHFSSAFFITASVVQTEGTLCVCQVSFFQVRLSAKTTEDICIFHVWQPATAKNLKWRKPKIQICVCACVCVKVRVAGHAEVD